MKKEDFENVKKLIRNATDEEKLQKLNKLVIQRIRGISEEMTDLFNIGDIVIVHTTKKGDMEGTVQKINRKTIDVTTEQHGEWRVTATMLDKVEE